MLSSYNFAIIVLEIKERTNMRCFAAFFQGTPKIGTIFKHRDIDLYLKISRRGSRKANIVVQYGYLLEGEFTPLPKRSLREISNRRLHYNYDEISC